MLFACDAHEQNLPPYLIDYDDMVFGAAQEELYLPMLQDKKVAIVANHTSLLNQQHVVDHLLDNGVHILKVFSPEHGFRGNKSDGAIIEDQIDPKTGLPIISLYGNHKKPTADDLEGVDVVIFDIQDVGVRFYTYISTMTYLMEACAEFEIPLIIFDRPNPNGYYVDGPIMEQQHTSFVGLHRVPVVHGMTTGEYALMVNGESWLANNLKCDLTVIKVKGYSHDNTFDLPVPPSPNLPSFNAVRLYPSLAFFEGTVVSVGRGTPSPFEIIGHPEFSDKSFSFTPESIPGASINPPLKGQQCFGLDLRNYQSTAGKIQLHWLLQFYADLHEKTDFFNNYFENLSGQKNLRNQIIEGWSEKEIRAAWLKGLDEYKKIRAKYLLYPDFE